MGLNLEQKQAVVAEVAKQVAGAQAIVMAQNRGMPVADMIVLRAKARASGVRRISGGLIRATSHGTTSSEHSPGTIPASAHKGKVTGT